MKIQNLRMMAVFAKVAEAGSFKQAAEQLNMAHSVVSKQVSDLEKELGVQLLFRSTRSLRLSESGQVFLEACNRMLQEAEEGFAALSNRSEQLKGNLRLTFPSVLLGENFAAFLMEFQQRYPAVQLDVECTDEVRDLIRDRFDLALHIGKLPDSQLFAQRLFDVQGVICVHARHTEIFDAIRQPHDLHAWQGLLLPELTKGFTLANYEGLPQEQLFKARHFMGMNTGSLIRDSLEYAPVWTVIPDFAVQQDLDTGVLKRLLPGWHVVADALYAVTPAQLSRLPLVAAFVQSLKAAVVRWCGHHGA